MNFYLVTKIYIICISYVYGVYKLSTIPFFLHYSIVNKYPEHHNIYSGLFSLVCIMEIIPGTFVEFHCGSGNISRSFIDCGFDVWSTDKRYRKGVCQPDFKSDIHNLTRRSCPYIKVNALWSSIPCTPFSYGSGNYYFANGEYKPIAIPYIAMLKKNLELIKIYNPDFYFIENPRGRMRHHPLMIDFLKSTKGVIKTITLSSYGHATTKPTNIFTNAVDWNPLPMDPYGRGNKNKSAQLFSNLTLHKRQSTPYNLGFEIATYVKKKLSSSYNLPDALELTGSFDSFLYPGLSVFK